MTENDRNKNQKTDENEGANSTSTADIDELASDSLRSESYDHDLEQLDSAHLDETQVEHEKDEVIDEVAQEPVRPNNQVVTEAPRASKLATGLAFLSLLLTLGLFGAGWWLWQSGQIAFDANARLAGASANAIGNTRESSQNRTQINALSSDLSSLKEDLAQEIETATNARINNLSDQLASLQGNIASASDGSANVEQTSRSIAQLESEIDSLKSQVENASTQYSGTLNSVQQDISRQARRLESMANISREDWLMAEVEYLLKLAHQRIRIEGDVDNAQAMLEEASAIVRDLENPELYPLREQLAKDLLDVKMVERIDTDGIYLSLSALADQVFRLPVGTNLQKKLQQTSTQQTPADEATRTAANQLPDTRDLPWYKKPGQALANFGRGLDRYVQIRKSKGTPEFMMTVDNESYLKQNLRLMLEKAQLALLKNDNAIYARTLTSVAQWVESYFPDTAKKNAFLAEVAALQEVSLERELPDLTQSQTLINDLINTYHQSKALGLNNGTVIRATNNRAAQTVENTRDKRSTEIDAPQVVTPSASAVEELSQTDDTNDQKSQAASNDASAEGGSL